MNRSVAPLLAFGYLSVFLAFLYPLDTFAENTESSQQIGDHAAAKDPTAGLPPGQSDHASKQTLPSRWTWDKVKISNSKDLRPSTFSYVVTKRDGKWEVLGEFGKVRADLESDEKREIISFNPESATLHAAYTATCSKGTLKSQTECSCAKGVFGETREKHGYQLCTSEFKTVSGGAINALSTILGTAQGLVVGTTSVVYRVDMNALLAATRETGLLDMINAKFYQDYYVANFSSSKGAVDKLQKFIKVATTSGYDPDRLVPEAEKQISELKEKAAIEKKEKQLQAYRRSFDTATTSSDIRTFIQRYTDNDPDLLIPKANEKLRIAEAADAREAERQREVERKEAEHQRKVAQAEAKRLTEWQNSLKVGDDTNCGPVLERKAALIKVYFPVENYGNEHWIKADLIERPTNGCLFVNGKYRPG